MGGSFDGVFIRGTCRRKTGGEEKGGRENFLFGFFSQEGFLFSLGKRRESRGNYQSRHADGSLSGGTLRRCRVRILEVNSPLGSSGIVIIVICRLPQLESRMHSLSIMHPCLLLTKLQLWTRNFKTYKLIRGVAKSYLHPTSNLY